MHHDVHASEGADTHESLHHASPESALDAALTALRAKGERVTVGRLSVLDVLTRTHDHVSADQIVALLEREHPGVHRATVYRTLDMLAAHDIVSFVHGPGGASLYHLAATTAGHEHLHAHCRVCGEVVVVPADSLDGASAAALRASGFSIDPLRSTLVGVCADCTEAGLDRVQAGARHHLVVPDEPAQAPRAER